MRESTCKCHDENRCKRLVNAFVQKYSKNNHIRSSSSFFRKLLSFKTSLTSKLCHSQKKNMFPMFFFCKKKLTKMILHFSSLSLYMCVCMNVCVYECVCVYVCMNVCVCFFMHGYSIIQLIPLTSRI